MCVCFFVGTNVTEHEDLSSNSDHIKIVVKNFVQIQISRGFLAQNYDNCHNSDKKSRFFLLKKKALKVKPKRVKRFGYFCCF